MGNGITDWVKAHKLPLSQVGAVIAIAIIISAIMVSGMAPSKRLYNFDITRLGVADVVMSANISALAGNVSSLASNVSVNKAQIAVTDGKASSNTAGINGLKTRVGTAESDIVALATQVRVPLEGHLTGTFGNYTLTAKCDYAGNFTANVHLVYSPSISSSNTTTRDAAEQAFYGDVDWIEADDMRYIPVLVCTNTTWRIAQVWFNIGVFAMVANNETAVDITFAGLSSAYEPDFAYVEVWPVLC